MSSIVATIVKVVLLIAILFLGYTLFEIIQEPIRFENIKEKRYDLTKLRLEQIRDAQKAYRAEYGEFANDFNTLISFVDTGRQSIIERKDSTFTYYDEIYQQERNKDTIVTRVIGYRNIKKSLFGEDFKSAKLQYIPYTEPREKFEMAAEKININDIVVPVFEAKAHNKRIFNDVWKDYDQYIDQDYALTVGSLTEPKLSGNWR